ncbi:hypothetical protein [Ignavibacterium album]|nr:hypothetical protein [Ignavibacterium album]
MKKIFLTSILVFATLHSFASNGEKKSYSIVEVVTPAKEIYDDGIYRTLFSAFYITNEEGNKVLSSGEVFDKAANVKLTEGTYKIYYSDSNGKLSSKDLEVTKGNFLRIELK